MKTQRGVLACLLVCVLAISGCYESLVSIATPDKVVFYEDLVGRYKATGSGSGGIELSRGQDKGYAYTQFNDKGDVEGKGTFHVVKLGDEHFWQITADRFNTTDGKPVYGIGRLVIGTKDGARTLTTYGMKSPEKFFEDAAITTVEYTYKENGEERKSRAISMAPEKLQERLLAHARDMTEQLLSYQQVPPKP